MMKSRILLAIIFMMALQPLYAAVGYWPTTSESDRFGAVSRSDRATRFGGARLRPIFWSAADPSTDSTAGSHNSGPITTRDQIDILLKEYDTLRADILLRSNVIFSVLAVAAGILAWFIQRHKESWFLPTFFAFVAIFIFIYWVNHQNIARAANRLKEIERKVNALATAPDGSPLLEWETKWGGTALGPFRQSASSGVEMDPWLASLLIAMLLCVMSLVYKVAAPWYWAKRYRGVNLKGRWDWEFECGGSRFSFRANIEQDAHKLAGAATVGKSVDGRSLYEETFRIAGSVYDGFVILSLIGEGRKSIPFATGMFKVGGEDKMLSGHLLYRFAADEIRSEKVELRLCFVEPG